MRGLQRSVQHVHTLWPFSRSLTTVAAASAEPNSAESGVEEEKDDRIPVTVRKKSVLSYCSGIEVWDVTAASQTDASGHHWFSGSRQNGESA